MGDASRELLLEISKTLLSGTLASTRGAMQLLQGLSGFLLASYTTVLVGFGKEAARRTPAPHMAGIAFCLLCVVVADRVCAGIDVPWHALRAGGFGRRAEGVRDACIGSAETADSSASVSNGWNRIFRGCLREAAIGGGYVRPAATGCESKSFH